MPRKYRLDEIPDINFSGLCKCGCGQKTNVEVWGSSKRRGTYHGYPNNYVSGHSGRWVNHTPQYETRDCGYETPCWIWLRTTNSGGYGFITDNGKPTNAHRVFYENKYGPIPDGMSIDHLCRIRTCVNPDHLEVVTQAENVRRGAKAQITMEDAREIRRMHAAGFSMAALSRLLSLSINIVTKVVYKTTWKEPE